MSKAGPVLAVFVCAALPCFAAGFPSQACLNGVAVDSSGSAVAGATITATALTSRSTRTVSTDGRGQFQICDVQPGQHRIVVHRDGFEDRAREATLTGDSTVDLSISLGPVISGAAKTGESVALQAASSPAVETNDLAGDRRPDGIFEFRGATGSTEALPDAPSSPRKNLPHGEAHGLLGSAAVAAPGVTLGDQLPVSDYGFAMGGSFGHDRTSYFVSFDHYGATRQNMLAFLTDLRNQPGIGSLALDEQPVAASALVARADHQFSARDSAYLRFSRNELSAYSLHHTPGKDTPGLATDFSSKQQAITAGNTVTISPQTTNQTQAQFISSDVQLPPGAGGMGVQSSLATLRRNRIFTAADNIYRQVGAQGLRLGGDFMYNQMAISFLESGLGRATGNSSLSQSSRNAGLYVQSERRVLPNLLLTSGIRYDVQKLRGFETDTNNVAPQIGVAWAPSSTTVIRGGASIYYDQIPLPAIAGPTGIDEVANVQNSSSLINRNGLSASQLGSFVTRSPSMQNSYAEHLDAEIDQQIGASGVLSAQTQYVRGVQLALPMMRPAALCGSAQGCMAGNVFWGQELGTGASSTSQATTVAFSQRPSGWSNYSVSYTWLTAEGSGTGANSSYVNDQMRRVSFTGVLHSSAEPGSTLWEHLANGFVLTETGDFTNRNEFAGMNFVNLNARLTKTLVWGKGYRLDAMAQTFNAWQRTNAAFARLADQMGDAAAGLLTTYQRVASFQNPEGTQFGLRLNF